MPRNRFKTFPSPKIQGKDSRIRFKAPSFKQQRVFQDMFVTRQQSLSTAAVAIDATTSIDEKAVLAQTLIKARMALEDFYAEYIIELFADTNWQDDDDQVITKLTSEMLPDMPAHELAFMVDCINDLFGVGADVPNAKLVA